MNNVKIVNIFISRRNVSFMCQNNEKESNFTFMWLLAWNYIFIMCLCEFKILKCDAVTLMKLFSRVFGVIVDPFKITQ